ncbi:MAG: TonB-dependent receptor [Bacteroidota bacterium]
MKKTITLLIIAFFSMQLFSQNKTEEKRDSTLYKALNEVVISALRISTPLKEIPAAITYVDNSQLTTMAKTIAADEALRLVPGVKVDNGTDGSRVHVYMRGTGVLSETGFRGIQVLIDGISVNDPAGYAPDLYDVDWNTVKSVEVVKGLSASMYGGSATGGVLNINTFDGGPKPVNISLFASGGSYGFWKTGLQVDGTKEKVKYRISYSHIAGDGYRLHQSFRGDNFSEKIIWTPTEKIKITQTLGYTNYYNQNSEGINWGRYDTVGPQAANTDAIRYNEFQITHRLTGSLLGKFDISKNQDITISGFFRFNDYRETSNNGDDYKPYTNPGVSAQYNLHLGKDNFKNHLSIGADYKSMTLNEHMFAVPDGAHINNDRVDSYYSFEAFDTDQILVNQVIKQRGAGIYLIDKLDIIKKLFITLNLRYDYVYNQLINNLPMSDSLSRAGNRTFSKPTYRLGMAYDICKAANIYASWGTGFLMPTNNELYNNPVTWGGFNSIIKPTTSQGAEIGVRGEIGKIFYYNLTGFGIWSKNEFYRYSLPDRGNNTAFYGNVGSSTKYGLETFFSVSPAKFVALDVAYTYSNFKYTSPDSVSGHFIPECPQHMLTAEATFKFLKHFTLALSTQFQSKWGIQVDDSIYNQYHENGLVRSSWVKGFNIYSGQLAYNWKMGPIEGELSFMVKNMFDEHYFGFTEPNNGPDYNSYQPAPGREFFGALKLKF